MTDHIVSKGALLMAVALLVFSAAPMARSVTLFNNVQIFVNTNARLPYSYTFSAYNQTGSLVGTYQSSYPAAGFELPTGDYLFTVSATQYNSCFDVCLYPSSPPVSGSTSSGNATTSIMFTFRQASEYGYAVESVNGPTAFFIQTQNVTLLPTSPVTVKVTFANGTAAVGADVSASIVGQNYYWWNSNSNTVMYNQTNSLGIAHLILPQAPVVISAWDWVTVNQPVGNGTAPVYPPPVRNGTVTTTKIGGQAINITEYWQTTYVGLSASITVIPPYGDISLTLKYQQPEGWMVPLGVASQTNGVPSTVQSAPSTSGSSLSQSYLPSNIPLISSIRPIGTTQNYDFIITGVVLATAISAGLITMTMIRTRTRPRDE